MAPEVGWNSSRGTSFRDFELLFRALVGFGGRDFAPVLHPGPVMAGATLTTPLLPMAQYGRAHIGVIDATARPHS